jgi:hypothetical protein
MAGDLLLVGSIPLDTPEQVLRRVGGPLGPYLAYMPDGEVGDRRYWIDGIEPNELCARLHNRMPVVLAPEAWHAWIGEELADMAQLESLLAPYPSDGMIAWPVSPRVGNVKNNDPTLVEPIAAM